MVCYVPAASTTFLAFFSFFLALAINSTYEANKVDGTPLSSLYYLDVYAPSPAMSI